MDIEAVGSILVTVEKLFTEDVFSVRSYAYSHTFSWLSLKNC